MNDRISGVSVHTGDEDFDGFYERIKHFLLQDRQTLVIDGQSIRGYRSPDSKALWLRDHSDILRGARYFDDDLQSATQHFADTQAYNGRLFDYVTYGPEKPEEKENWLKYIRVPVEADVEFRFVKALYLAWQATGDDEWMFRLLPAAERALEYALTHPWRWHAPWGVVKRPYTIDTWDFDYTAGRHNWLNFQITPHTFWGVMHGDNSGYYEAMVIMARLCSHVNWPGKAVNWRQRADALRKATNKVCWNGRFYTHFVPITPVEIPGVDEKAQLSLSNPMDINRGLADHRKAVSILREYQRRKESTGAFAEWFSIDPPFPGGIFGEKKLVAGSYVNGGIMPLVGGEIARAAFIHGLESYGVDTLRQYAQMIAETGETYLWYFPDGTPSTVETSTSPDAMPTDGWGSSAMLYAFVEGLCGVIDKHKLFEKLELAPRWLAAGIHSAQVQVGYASGAGVAYDFQYKPEENRLLLDIRAPGSVQLHVLLPDGREVQSVEFNGKAAAYQVRKVERSRYLDGTLKSGGKLEVVLGE